MLLGYARVSTETQNLDRQLDLLNLANCERIYQEKITGTTKERPELEKMLDSLRCGDTIVVCELTRLSRSTKDLFKLVEEINNKGCNIKSLKETWLDTTTPQGKLMFTIFAGISQFERDLISQRTKEGLESARARGRKGGRPKKNTDDINKALRLYNSKEYSLKEIYEMTGVSQTSLYRYLKSFKDKESLNDFKVENIAKMRMCLRVENNNKFVRGKSKVRKEIEYYLQRNYNLEEFSINSRAYIFYVPYKTIDDLNNTVYYIAEEINNEADYRNCFTEFDIYCDELNLSW